MICLPLQVMTSYQENKQGREQATGVLSEVLHNI